MFEARNYTIFRTFSLLFVLTVGVFIGCTATTSDELIGAQSTDDGLVIARGEQPIFTLQAIEHLQFTPDVAMIFGMFTHTAADISVSKSVDSTSTDAIATSVQITPLDEGQVRLTIPAESSQRGIRLTFACNIEDRFWGFGEQYNFVDMRGHKVPIWVMEQGVGRDEKGSQHALGVGDFYQSYFPMPYFIDPQKSASMLVENTEYAEFDLCESNEDSWTVEIWTNEDTSLIIDQTAMPVDLIRNLTATVGRPSKRPPDWSFDGIWLAAQGGSDKVQQRLETAAKEGVPVSAVWVQDWIGLRNFGNDNFGLKYRWSIDRSLYPSLESDITRWKSDGVRFLGYFNPFIVDDFDVWTTATTNGYTIQTPDGDPHVFEIVTFDGTMLDVSNPDAVNFFQEFARDAIAMGQHGWMADFGEWLPTDAVIANGDPAKEHNLYPTKWHAINKEVLEDAYPDGDYVLLTRSGYTGEQSVAQIVWAGDQETFFDEEDGMVTVLRAGLTLGMAGVPFFTHDIGGFSGGPREKDVFMRWVELGAFTPFMRTHDGIRKTENVHFDHDADTLAHFARMGQAHALLSGYFKALADKAVDEGTPIITHTAFVDPEYDAALNAHEQWMLGEDLLIAPVYDTSTRVSAILPEGEWQHIASGKTYAGRTVVNVEAPIGTPAAFVRTTLRTDEGAKQLAPILSDLKALLQ